MKHEDVRNITLEEIRKMTATDVRNIDLKLVSLEQLREIYKLDFVKEIRSMSAGSKKNADQIHSIILNNGENDEDYVDVYITSSDYDFMNYNFGILKK